MSLQVSWRPPVAQKPAPPSPGSLPRSLRIGGPNRRPFVASPSGPLVGVPLVLQSGEFDRARADGLDAVEEVVLGEVERLERVGVRLDGDAVFEQRADLVVPVTVLLQGFDTVRLRDDDDVVVGFPVLDEVARDGYRGRSSVPVSLYQVKHRLHASTDNWRPGSYLTATLFELGDPSVAMILLGVPGRTLPHGRIA